MAIPIKDIEKLFVKESGSVVIYYTKPYKDKEYTNTVYPVDTEGFVAALQQVIPEPDLNNKEAVACPVDNGISSRFHL